MKKIQQLPKLILAHLSIKIIIFLIFFIGIVVKVSVPFLYLMLILIVANLIVGIINKQRAIMMNISFFILGWLQFLIFIGYIATIIGSLLSLIHLVFFLRIILTSKTIQK